MDEVAQMRRQEEVTKWGISCFIFGVVTLLLLVMAFGSHRDGETLVNNLQYLSHGQIIVWLVSLNVMGVATVVSMKMLHQAEHPPTDTSPVSWVEEAIIGTLFSLLIWCMFIPSVHLIW